MDWWIEARRLHLEVRRFLVNKEQMEAIRSVLSGESLKDWLSRKDFPQTDNPNGESGER